MPPKIHPRVRSYVEYAIWRTAQDYIQAATLAHLDRGLGDPAVIRRLDFSRAWWTVWKNKGGHSLVLARIRYTDGYEVSCKWRVSYDQSVWGGNYMRLNLRSRVTFTRRLDLCILNGRAGGLRVATGEVSNSPVRSRPEIGRAYRARRASN